MIRDYVPGTNLDDIPDKQLKSKSEDELLKMKLSRSLSSFIIHNVTGCSIQDSIQAVTDGYEDNGVDIVYIDDDSKVLYLGQSKWKQDGNGTPSLAEVIRFIDGANDIIDTKFSNTKSRVNKYYSYVNKWHIFF